MLDFPHIDLTATPDALRQYAQEYFGKKISTQAKDDTVRERFAQIYLEETGITLEGVDQQEKKSGTQAEPEVKRKPKFATIIIQDDEKDPSPVTGSVQFVAYRIKRNVEVKVRWAIVESLKNAVRTVYDPETMAPKDVTGYPFSIVELHY